MPLTPSLSVMMSTRMMVACGHVVCIYCNVIQRGPEYAYRRETVYQAVCDVYGWDDMGGEEEILRRLLALNLARAGDSGD